MERVPELENTAAMPASTKKLPATKILPACTKIVTATTKIVSSSTNIVPASTKATEYYARVSPTSTEYTKVVLRDDGEVTMRPAVMIKPRKTNFTPKEVEVLLTAVAKRRETVLFGVAGGLVWAQAWQDVANEVCAVEGICRSESDVRKKWTYLKWEAKNTSKPDRDPTSRAVLEILTARDPEKSARAKALLEEVLVPTNSSNSTVPNPVATQGPSRTTNSPSTYHSALPTITQQTPVQNHPSEVCLKWNSYHLNMQAVFPSLLSNEQFVDVTLACEGQSIKCHKIILSACSAYFEQLLSQNPCQHPIVLMKDLHFWQVQALVEFMYRGEVNVAQDKLPSLLSAAEALQIKGLAHPTTTTTTTPNTTASTTTASSTTSLRDQDSVPVSSAADSVTPHRAVDEPQPSLIRTRRRHSSSTPIILRQCIDVSKQASRSLLQPKCTNKLKLHSCTKAESTETMDELSNLTKLSGPYKVKMIKTESPLEEGRHSGIKVKMEPVEIKTEAEEDEDMEMENEDSYDFDTSFVDEVMGAELRVVEEDGGLEDFECTDKGQNDNAHNSDMEEQSAVMDTEDTLMPDSGKTGGPEKKRPK